MPPSARLLIHPFRDVTIVNVNQTSLLEAGLIQQIGEELYELVDGQARKKIILDFTKVQNLSSSALSVLITLQKKAEPIKGQIVLCGLRKELKTVFKVSRLDRLFVFCDDEEQALAHFGVTTAG